MAKQRAYGDTGTGKMNTIIGKGSLMEGVFRIDSSIRIDGTVKGELTSSDAVIVGTSGLVEVSLLKAKSIVIGGKVVGNLEIEERTHLQARSVLHGDLKTRVLLIEEGAVFKGNCDSGGEDAKAAPKA